MFRIRPIRHSDIPFAIRLCDQERWQVTRTDLNRILRLDSRGSFLACEGSRRLGMATSTSYGKKLAWIGNVIVDRKYRGETIGRELVQHTLRYLKRRSIRHVALYCFAKNLRFYERLGFMSEATFARLSRIGKRTNFQTPAQGLNYTCRAEEVVSMDRRAFGADRSKLLKFVIRDKTGFWIVQSKDSRMSSCMMIRRYDGMCEFGPWNSLSSSKEELSAMLHGALNEAYGRPVEISALRSNSLVLRLLRDNGFLVIREGYRMFYSERPHLGDDHMQCALGFLDKG